jgi:hypothetical protein
MKPETPKVPAKTETGASFTPPRVIQHAKTETGASIAPPIILKTVKK